MVAKFSILAKKIYTTRLTNSLPHDRVCLKERLAIIFILYVELYNQHIYQYLRNQVLFKASLS